MKGVLLSAPLFCELKQVLVAGKAILMQPPSGSNALTLSLPIPSVLVLPL